MASNTIQQAINAYFVSDTDAHDEIGDRAYWVEAPAKAIKPYMTYYLISDPHEPFAFNRTDAGQARVQFNVYDDDRYEALRIGDKMRDQIDQYGGAMDGVAVTFIKCTGTRVSKMFDDKDYVASFDALINYDDA